MVEDDEFIAGLFEQAAGDGPSATEALAHVQPRIRRAHRRRAVLRGSAGLIVLVLLGSLVSRTAHQPSERVHVGDVATTAMVDSTSTSVAPSTTLPHAGPQTPPAAAVTTVPSDPAQGASSEAAAAPQGSPAPSAPAATSGSKAKAASPPKAPASSTTAAPGAGAGAPSSVPPPQVTSFDGQGGTVEVKYTDTSMEVESVSPSPGWSVADTRSDGASIEVTFQSDDGSNTGIGVHLDEGGRPTIDTPIDPADDVVNALTGS